MTLEATKRVIEHLKQGRVISVLSAPVQRLSDARGLILLSQIVYWTVRDKRVPEADGWFVKSLQGWQTETGLSRNYLNSALDTLEYTQLVKTWRKSKGSSPWLKLDLNKLHVFCQGAMPLENIELPRFINERPFREQMIGKTLPYFTLLTDITGDALHGLFLSRCIFWQEILETKNRLLNGKAAWGWSSKDWHADIGLSRAQLRNAITKCHELKLIEVCEINRPFQGVWVDMEAVEHAIHKVSGQQSIKANNVPAINGTVNFNENEGLDSENGATVQERKKVYSVNKFPNVHTPEQEGSTTVRERKKVYSVNIFPNADSSSESAQATAQNAQETLFKSAEFEHGSAENGQKTHGFRQQNDEFAQQLVEYEQSTRARKQELNGSLNITTTTNSQPLPSQTENVVVVVDLLENLSYPPCLDAERQALKATIARAIPERQQKLLDEVSGRLSVRGKDSIANIVSYLSSLVRKDNEVSGQLVLEYAHLPEASRQNAARMAALKNANPIDLDKQKKNSESTKGSEAGHKAISAMLSTLARKKA